MAELVQSSTEAEGNPRDVSESSSDSENAPFSEEEEELVMRMYRLVGDRWSLIAGRIPGRTDTEIMLYWNAKNSSQNCSVQK